MNRTPPSAAGFIAHLRESDRTAQPLEAHLLAVAALARRFAAKIGLANLGEILGLLHDLGKYSFAFQAYIKSAVGLLDQDQDDDFVDASQLKGTIDHSTAGAQFAWNDLKERGQLGQIVGQILSICLAGHHSGLIDCLTASPDDFGRNDFSRRMGKSSDKTHLQEVLGRAPASVIERAGFLLGLAENLAGPQAVMNRIIQSAPEKTDRSVVVQHQFGLLLRFLFSCLIDADRLDTADFENPRSAALRLRGQYSDWGTLRDRLELHLASLENRATVDAIRGRISDQCRTAAERPRGVHTLTVPTGGGKTLASLRFAVEHAATHGLERIVYVVPYTSIIDQNADVIRRILEPSGERGRIVLEHHSNLTPERQTWRGKMLAESWDAPIVLTTMVQFLEALFGGGTRGARRMHQLANAVVVFDEIQALPVSCVHLFNNGIDFLVRICGMSAVLCTATQPLLGAVDATRGALRLSEESELIPDVPGLFAELKRTEILDRRRPEGWTFDEAGDLALALASSSGSCLVVVNTKAAARAVYGYCKERFEGQTCHLSTDMCPAHRRVVLDRVRSRLGERGGMICVSTQLIEAGVDVDFGTVIRSLAGLDSIAQAAGRCNRHGRRAVGVVQIVDLKEERLDALRDIRVGQEKARRVLDDLRDHPESYPGGAVGPEAMAWYYRNYFFARAQEMGFQVGVERLGHDDDLLSLLSTNSLAVAEHARLTGAAPPIYFRQSFMAAGKAFRAIDAPNQGVVVPYSDEGQAVVADLLGSFEVTRDLGLLRTAQQYSVNVFPATLRRLMEAGALIEAGEGTGVHCLSARYYSDEFGLSETPLKGLEDLHA